MKVKEIQEKEKINLQLRNKKKVQKLKEKGITLIALVVTIIILLILVGVTISQLSGENGLIKRAKEAVERYKNAAEQEQIQLGEQEQYVSELSNQTSENAGTEEEKKKVIEIKKGLNSKTTQIIPLNGIEGYKTFSVDNFFIVGDKFGWEWNSSVVDVQTMTRSYDSNNGVLTLGPLTVKFKKEADEHYNGAGWLLYDVYYIE